MRKYFNHKNSVLFSVLYFVFSVSSASAQPVPFFDTIANGRTTFDTQITSVGGTLNTLALVGLANNVNSWDMGDFTITATNGVNRVVNNVVLTGGDAINMSANGLVTSGLTYTFDSPINGFGVELQDWATCCYPSSLYIQFDGGAPILVGTATQNSDNPGMADSNRTFIGAIDDSATFSVITFYGTGNGDVLYAGGIIRYAIVPIGSISGNYVGTAQPTPVSGLASYLDSNDDSGDLQTVANYLNTASSDQIEQAMKTIFPVNTTVVGQTMSGTMGQTSNTVMEKVGTVLGNMTGAGVGGIASTESAFSQTSPDAFFSDVTAFSDEKFEGTAIAAFSSLPYKRFVADDSAFWIEGVGAGTNGKKTDTTLGYDSVSKGFVMGYERGIREDILIGILGSGFQTRVMTDEHAGNTQAYNYSLGVYGQKIFGASKLTGAVMYGYGKYDSVRHVDVGGITGSPEAEYDGRSIGTTLGASHLFEHGGFKIEPFSTIAYTAVSTESYSEQNGGVYNNDVSADRFSMLNARAGVTLFRDVTAWEENMTFKVKPYIGRQWEIESADNRISLVGGSGSTVINGRDADIFEFGFAAEGKIDFTPAKSLKLGVDLSRDKNEERGIVYLGYGYKF